MSGTSIIAKFSMSLKTQVKILTLKSKGFNVSTYDFKEKNK